MKKILATLFMVLTFVPCLANKVDVKKTTTAQHAGGARIPASLPIITADYTDGLLSTTSPKAEMSTLSLQSEM